MRTAFVFLTALGALACSSTTDPEGVAVQVVVQAPITTILDVDDTTRVSAVALNQLGDTLPTPVVWQALDTTISVDAAGAIRALVTGLGRVRANSGTLQSNIVNFTVVPRPDTLVIVGDDTLRVLVGEGSSAALATRLDSYSMGDTIPANAGQIVYQILEPDSTQPRSVEFTGQTLTTIATTGTDGTPLIPILLNRVVGVTSPDSAIVGILALRFQGTDTVPGSGQRFIVRFDN
jgi:hypothetical protein